MTSERISDSGRSEDSGESIWGSFNVYKNVSFWLLVTVGIILLLREYRIYQSKGVQQTMPGDTDISHAVETRLTAIEARLDALDGGPEEEREGEGEGEGETPPEEAAVTSYSSRSRSRKVPDTTEGTE